MQYVCSARRAVYGRDKLCLRDNDVCASLLVVFSGNGRGNIVAVLNEAGLIEAALKRVTKNAVETSLYGIIVGLYLIIVKVACPREADLPRLYSLA